MMKTALLLAFAANVLLIVSVQGKSKCHPKSGSEATASTTASSESSSSSSSASSHASSSSSSHSSSDNGDCGKKKCPGPHEEYDECPAPCPPRRCDVDDRLIRCAAPPKKGDPDCKPGCRCSDPYVRNDKGICVLREQCPNTHKCGRNEVYDLCPAKCPFRTCGIDDTLIDCRPSPTVGDPDCPPPACRCANGYYRDDQGNCVKWDKCPKCTKPNEEYDPCPAPCPPRECGVDPSVILCLVPPQLGDPKCEPGCRCSDNYLRNDEGICIPKEQCPSNLICKENEVYSNCTQAICRALDCLQKGKPIACASVAEGSCIKGCVCAPGTLRDSHGNCVPEDQCDQPSCGPNEDFSECTQAVCRHLKCTQKGGAIVCASIAKGGCIKGCVCAPDYLRDSSGNCVPEDESEDQCNRPHEEYQECPDCSPGTCESIGKIYHCPLRNKTNCVGACRCKPGYKYNKIGDCITEAQCLQCNKPHEFYSCGSACDNVCADLNIQNRTNCPIINIKCNEKCYCEDGYARDDDNNCIPIDQCKPAKVECNKPNEEYQKFPDCSPGTCESIGKVYDCPLHNATNCVGACRCKPGYYYNKIGECITKAQCLQCNGTHEFYSCGPECDNVCADLDKQNRTNCPIINVKCNEKCYCEDGYARDDNNICIPDDQCKPKPESCGGDPNAIPGCGVNCGRLCSNYKNGDQVVCPAICKLNGCDCKKGYVLNTDTNLCVLPEQCPITEDQCNRPHEEYQECPDCSPGTCESIGKIYHCPLRNKTNCVGACRCKPGYKYNKIGDCITEAQCLQCNKPHEFYSCGSACDNVCADLNIQNRTNCPIINIKCNEKCYCEDGYARDDDNNCIPIDQCKPAKVECNKPNEEYQNFPDCSPGTCESIGKVYDCPLHNATNCVGACRCKPGYYYNKIGECITKAQCLQCNGTHEFYSCGPECDNVCADLDKQNRTNCPIINVKCNEKCYCEDGYARDDNKICIPDDQCKPRCTKPNEEYQECANCSPGTCDTIGQSFSCPAVCISACRCKPGYFYNKNGDCVPKEECTSCGGDPNAQPGCGTNCGKLCNSHGKPGSACSHACSVDGCDCKDGYLYDTNTRRCVLPSDCSKPCGKDEQYSGCINGGCDKRLCSQIDKPSICIDPIKCEGGCICRDRYLRDSNGTCIPEEQCPRPPKCPVNEEWYDCLEAVCRIQDCTQKGQEIACAAVVPEVCHKGCLCSEGYLRNSNGTCVPVDQCDCGEPKCGVNEEFTKCKEGVCRIQDCSQKGQEISCAAVVPEVCTEGCICSKGNLRNCKGICVPEDQCEAPKCGVNEEFSKCIEGVCRIQDCSQKGQGGISCIAAVPDVCTEGCLCSKGNLRNSNGTCVPEDQCEVCPEGETFSNCPPVYRDDCNSEYCPKSRNDPAICPTTRQCGKPKCVCGYLDKRDRETGKCVRASDCPPFPCDLPNEEYQSCPAGCPGENCTDYLENTQCPKYKIGIVVPCKPACKCLKGFYRNSDGICVDSSKCTECPEGEIYSKCPPIQCDAEYCPLSRDSALTCPTPKKCTRPRCICGFNSHRSRLTGKCIPTRDCPAFPCDGKNEVYDSCPPGCPGQNCTDYINKTTCPKFRIGIVVPCKPACRCDKNTYRNSKGVCVSEEECECDN